MQKGGAGSALLIGAALALFCKGRDEGGTWTRRGKFCKINNAEKKKK
jgi:hypothetical protein